MGEPFKMGGGGGVRLGNQGSGGAQGRVTFLFAKLDGGLQGFCDSRQLLRGDVFHFVGQLAEAVGAEVGAPVAFDIAGAEVEQVGVAAATDAVGGGEVAPLDARELLHQRAASSSLTPSISRLSTLWNSSLVIANT